MVHKRDNSQQTLRNARCGFKFLKSGAHFSYQIAQAWETDNIKSRQRQGLTSLTAAEGVKWHFHILLGNSSISLNEYVRPSQPKTPSWGTNPKETFPHVHKTACVREADITVGNPQRHKSPRRGHAQWSSVGYQPRHWLLLLSRLRRVRLCATP